MTEKARQESIQDALQSMDDFDDAWVVINDNYVLDKRGSKIEGRNIAIIYTSDTFSSTQRTRVPETNWDIIVRIFTAFKDWKTSLDDFRDLREAVLTEFNSVSESNRTSDGAWISEIRNGSNVLSIYDPFTDQEQQNAQPTHLAQDIIFVTEEY